MSYTGILFNQIPYEVRESDTPIYEENLIETYLLAHYLGNKQALLDDVISVFHDDKHSGNMMTVDTKKTKGTFWYPASNCEEEENYEYEDHNAVGLIFQRSFFNSENIVKQTCKELGITQKELAERIKVSEKSVSDWARGASPIPDWVNVMFELLIKSQRYDKIITLIQQETQKK